MRLRLRSSARRLLQFIEQEIAHQGGERAKLFDDQLACVGSKRVIVPGINELAALGLIEHRRDQKCSHIALSQDWRAITNLQQALILSAKGRAIRTIRGVEHDDARSDFPAPTA